MTDEQLPKPVDSPKAKQFSTNSRFEQLVILTMSILFLVLVVGVVLLVGTGRINIGLDPTLAFLVYVIAGLLVSFATFGILTSSGELSGSPFGVNARLGGALVAAVVVMAGGGLFEIYVRPSAFSTRVAFYESSIANLIKPAGSFSIYVGAGTRTETIQPDGTALFQNLGKRATYRFSLDSPGYEVDSSTETSVVLAPDTLVYVKVKRKAPFEAYESSNVRLEFAHAFANHAMDTKFSLVVHINAWNSSERPVPIRGTAEIRFTKAGLPFRQLIGELADGTMNDVLSLRPRAAEKLILNVMMPSDYEELLNLGLDAEVTLKYADPNRVDGGDYQMASVPFVAKNFPIE